MTTPLLHASRNAFLSCHFMYIPASVSNVDIARTFVVHELIVSIDTEILLKIIRNNFLFFKRFNSQISRYAIAFIDYFRNQEFAKIFS